MEGMIGEVRLFAGNFAPRTWAFCEGQLLAISQNTALFSIIGTTYGGDGRTSFALPDLRGRAPIGPGTGPGLSTRKLGQRSGTETNTSTLNNLANHNHLIDASNTKTTLYASTDPADHDVPGPNSVLASAVDVNGDPVNIYNTQTPNTTITGGALSGSITTLPQGNQHPINNMQPFLGMNYIICMQGIFPSRS